MKKLLLIGLITVLGLNVQVDAALPDGPYGSSYLPFGNGNYHQGFNPQPAPEDQAPENPEVPADNNVPPVNNDPIREQPKNSDDLAEARFLEMMEKGSADGSYKECDCSPLTWTEVKSNLICMRSYLQEKYSMLRNKFAHKSDAISQPAKVRTMDAEIDATESKSLKKGAEIATQTESFASQSEEKEMVSNKMLSDNQYAMIGVTCAALAVYGSYKFAKWAYNKYQSSNKKKRKVKFANLP